jgi:hypothetical protein
LITFIHKEDEMTDSTKTPPAPEQEKITQVKEPQKTINPSRESIPQSRYGRDSDFAKKQ